MVGIFWRRIYCGMAVILLISVLSYQRLGFWYDKSERLFRLKMIKQKRKTLNTKTLAK